MRLDMTRSEWPVVSRILDEALKLPPESRRSHIESACGGDSRLKSQVTAILEAGDLAGDFLEGRCLLPGELDPHLPEDRAVGSPGRNKTR